MRNARNAPGERDLTTREAAEVLGVVPATVRANADRLGGRKVLGRWRWPAATIRAAATAPTPQENS